MAGDEHTGTKVSSVMTPLGADTAAFNFVEYYLRLGLQANTARVVSAWEVSNPQLTLQFERRSKGLLTLDAWVDLQHEKKQQANNGIRLDEREIMTKGFQMDGSHGMKFRVGQILGLQGEDTANGIVRRRLLLCKLAVGRAYNATEDFAKIANLPEGYDSFVLDEGTNEDGADPISQGEWPAQQGHQEQEGAAYSFEYMVKEGTQVLPTFLIECEYDPEKERRSKQPKQCDNCEQAGATLFCVTEGASLCAGCDAQLHSSRLTSRHPRTPLVGGQGDPAQLVSMALAAAAAGSSTCRTHVDQRVEFFCTVCQTAVCVHCKMVGNHSSGEAARHRLITIAEAFKGVLTATQARDPLLEARKERLAGQMSSVRDRAKAVLSNTATVQQHLDEAYKRAQAELRGLTKRKLNILQGDLIELHRQNAEIDWMERFVAYCRETVIQGSGTGQEGFGCTQFILDWSHQQKLRGELHSFAHFREAIDVAADMRIAGSLQVVLDKQPGSSSSSPSNGADNGSLMNGRMASLHTLNLAGAPTGAGSTLTMLRTRTGTNGTTATMNTVDILRTPRSANTQPTNNETQTLPSAGVTPIATVKT